MGGDVLGVSQDGLRSHEKFKKKYNLPFDLGADEEGIVCSLYDVIKEKSMYGRVYKGIERSTFLIDGQGQLFRKWTKVNVAGHIPEILISLRG